MTSYKGYVLDGLRKVRLEEFELPACGPDQVIIKNRCSAICGGDVSSYKFGGADNLMPDGVEFGHEMVADVVTVGEDVKGIHVGDRVYPYPYLAKADPMKSACLGGFSEYVVIEKAQLNHNLYLVDGAITDIEGSLIEPFTVGFRSANMIDPKPGENALVYGAGCIGVSAAIRFKEAGCSKVAVVERSRKRCDIVEGLGIKAVCTLDDDWKEQVIAYFGETYSILGRAPQVSLILDAVGNVGLWQDIQELMPSFTRISVVAIYHEPNTVDMRAITFGQNTIQGSGGYTPLEVEQVMDVMKSKRWNIESVVTHRYPHGEFNEAMEMACDAERALKVVIEYT